MEEDRLVEKRQRNGREETSRETDRGRMESKQLAEEDRGETDRTF